MRERERWRLRESDGERGIEKHLPSLLESRAVITELRRSDRGGGKERGTHKKRAAHIVLLQKEKVTMKDTHQ